MANDRSGLPASVIQRCWRAYRRRFHKSFQATQQHREEAAWKIQQRWWRKRGYTWRLEHKNYVTYQPLWEAAWTIQQAWWRKRGYTWRLHGTTPALFYAEHDAAWAIQNAWWRSRAYSEEQWERWDAALTIQDWWHWCLGFGACGAGYEHLRNWDPGPIGDGDEDDPLRYDEGDPLWGDIHYMRYVGGHHREEDDHFDKGTPCMFD